LRQILLNLAGNAIKFTQRGEVTLAITVLDRGADSIRVRCEVRDTGVGIPADRLSLLFAPFMQVDSSMTRRFGGTGLGLSIVKRLVELMGGQTGVESQEGIGSRFWFTVCFATQPQGDSAECLVGASTVADESSDGDGPALITEPVPRAPPPRLKRRILLAEDNPVNQQVAVRLLEKMDYAVQVAPDGRAAVDAWRSGGFDVILMDCQMPEMDGFEATAVIRNQEVGARRTPIVALTANAMKGDADFCRAAGMDGFISKPIDRAKLAACLAELLGNGESVR
jgi:CheY-like chemotaxis protein